jgi:hypothetical protein
MKAALVSLGCKVNQAEIDGLKKQVKKIKIQKLYSKGVLSVPSI